MPEFWTWTRKRMMQLSKRLGCKGVSETRLQDSTKTLRRRMLLVSLCLSVFIATS